MDRSDQPISNCVLQENEMNRTDRLLAIILELQAKGHLRAEDLAAIFETSKRTIYRDENSVRRMA